MRQQREREWQVEEDLESGYEVEYEYDSEYDMDGKTVFGDGDEEDEEDDYYYYYDSDYSYVDDEDGFEMQPLHRR